MLHPLLGCNPIPKMHLKVEVLEQIFPMASDGHKTIILHWKICYELLILFGCLIYFGSLKTRLLVILELMDKMCNPLK